MHLEGYRDKKKDGIYVIHVLPCATIALLRGNLKVTSAVLLAKAPTKILQIKI